MRPKQNLRSNNNFINYLKHFFFLKKQNFNHEECKNDFSMFRKQLLFTHTYLAPSLLVISPYCSLSRFSTRLRPYPGPGRAEDFEVLMLMFLPELKVKQFPYEGEGEGPTKVLEMRNI